MKKKEIENTLLVRARAELQKTNQSIFSGGAKDRLFEKIDKKLGEDVILLNDLQAAGLEPSQKLTDRITGREEALADLQAEISSRVTELHGNLDIAKSAIAELRKVNPKKANELENSLSLKIEGKKRSIKNKR